MRTRGFEVVSRMNEDDVRLPEVSTSKSAGYDFFAYEDVVIPPSLSLMHDPDGRFNPFVRWKWDFKPTIVKTGIKAYMTDDEALFLVSRSSMPKKLGLIISNALGVIDSDFYNNPDNEGEMCFMFYNLMPFPVTLKKGDKIGQGIFQKFLKADQHDWSDGASKARMGGIGSTGE